MIPHPFFYLMVVLGLLWIFFMLHIAWPNPCPATPQRPAEPILPRRPRSSEPKSFAGLTHKPQCVACEQAPPAPLVTVPAAPPPRITSTRGRKRQVDTSRHFCPNPDCPYRGWVGWGNLRANGLPTICQPRFVNFLPHLHDWLTTNAAGIIAGAMTQHGHKNTQQSVANIA